MVTLEIPADQLYAIAAGDRVIAVDGQAVGPITVESGLNATGVNGVKTVYDSPSGAARYLYPDAVGTAVTVERGAVEPERKQRKRPTSVIIRRYGFPLVRDRATDCYRTEDGRYQIWYNEGYLTSCEAPHPVRLSEESRARILENRHRRIIPWEATWAARNDKSGYLCPGGAEHEYARWVIWDFDTDDYVNCDVGGFDTLAEAARELASEIGAGGHADA